MTGNMRVNQLDLCCFLILDKDTQENNPYEELNDELFDHEDEDNSMDKKLDDIQRVLIIEGQQYSGDIDFYLYLQRFT